MKKIKKLNNILKSLKIFTLLILINGCTNLEPEIFDKLSPNNFPQSDADIEASVTAIYKSVKDAYTPSSLDHSHMMMNMLSTDELVTAWGGSWQTLNEFLWTENEMNVKNNYFTYVKGISRISLLLDDLKDREFINESIKKQSTAELHALRGYFTFQLFDLYGTFPLMIDAELLRDVEKQHFTERSSKEEIIKLIEDDLSIAINELPVNYSSDSSWGRVTKGAAYTMLLQLYLHEKNWQKSKDITEKIMGFGYELLDKYSDVFDIANESFSNKEVIWAIPLMATPGGFSNSWFACVGPQFPTYKSETGITMNVWGGLKMPWDSYDKFEEGKDNRLSGIIRYYEDQTGNLVDFRQVQHDKAVGASPKKYSEDPNHTGAQQGNDVIRYRYAHVLLARAEALNEINGPNNESINLINKIRSRAKLDEIKLTDYNKETLRDFILEERFRELYCEGYRRQDLIRHGKYISTAHKLGYTAAENKHVLYPIPQSAIDENPKIKQNPGY